MTRCCSIPIGEAAAGAEEFVRNYVDHNARTTGKYRFYDEQAEIRADGSATLLYCEDQSTAYVKSLKTGKVKTTDVTKDSYVVYNSVLRKNDDGVWITTELVSERGAEQCQP